jgi:hypothetical protein
MAITEPDCGGDGWTFGGCVGAGWTGTFSSDKVTYLPEIQPVPSGEISVGTAI